MINARAGAQNIGAERPGDSQPWIEVGMSGIRKSAAAGTISAARREIERDRPVVGFVEYIEEGITQSRIDGQVWRDFVLVRNVSIVLRFAQAFERKQGPVGCAVRGVA